MIKPLFQYPGSKRLFFKKYLERGLIPANSLSSYSEPFLGSGAIFCELVNKSLIKKYTTVYLNDLSVDLINLYTYLKETSKDNILKDVESYNLIVCRNSFEQLLKRYTEVEEPLAYLQIMGNCFGGVVRVNKKVSPGKFKKTVFDIKNVLNWSYVLKNYHINLTCKDYSDIPVCGFNFVDPPYIGCRRDMYISSNSDFFENVVKKYLGSNALITNNYSKEWYKFGYPVHLIPYSRNIFGKINERTEVAIEIKP